MPSHNEIANYIASISAFVGVISAILAYISYRNSLNNIKKNQRTSFASKFKQNLDSSYMALSDFVNNHHESTESREKRVARDKIMYLLEVLRSDLSCNQLVTNEIEQRCGDLEMKISDITYESNFEKVVRDLGKVKNSISILKDTLQSELIENK